MEGITLGTRNSHPVTLDADQRARHTLLIGSTGVGKSTLLESMAIQDIQAGRGIAFLDPHGFSAEKILNYIPPERVDDVIYFNLADRAMPIAYNPLYWPGSDERPEAVDSIVQAFKSIWTASWSDSLMQRLFLSGLYTAFAQKEPTMLTLHSVFTDELWRDASLDPFLTRSWAFLSRLSEKDRTQTYMSQFLLDYRARNVLGQYRTKFSFKDIMDKKQIFIANLSKGKAGHMNSKLFGALLLSQFYYHAMRRTKHCKNGNVFTEFSFNDECPECGEKWLDIRPANRIDSYVFETEPFQGQAHNRGRDIYDRSRKRYGRPRNIVEQEIESETH